MPSVAVNPPKTPCTSGSQGLATATLPNVCKMPGPPAPFVPTPLPNIGKSGDSPQGYSTTVTIEGNDVAIQGASFNSMGDIASKALGGGIVSMNCEGPTKFIAPGSMDVKVEGKNVQLLGDQMSNNNGPSGSPPNAATMAGLLQGPAILETLQDIADECNKKVDDGKTPKGHDCTTAGTAKHKCCSDELKKKDYENVDSEKSFGLDGTPAPHGAPCRPDVIVTNGGVRQVYDFKFNCKSEPSISKKQKDKYIKAFDSEPKLIHSWSG